MSERNICISIAASIQDVCRKNPDRGVDLILSVSVWVLKAVLSLLCPMHAVLNAILCLRIDRLALRAVIL